MSDQQHHHHHHHQLLLQPQPPQRAVATHHSRLRSSTGGEIVEVQGGHIVRSTGRKDRHSKVCTAKGPRDRRVRLSAHTAIQFYDVQDRLGYDRPSKAVDWLMKNAKAAIDELAELPAWNPTATATSGAALPALNSSNQLDSQVHGESSNKQMNVDEPGSSSAAYGYGGGGGGGGGGGSSSFLPPSLDSDSIADTIKSFFPMGAGAAPPSTAPSENSPIGFQNYPPDLLSRSSSTQNQDLRLSLQSFQDPIFHHPSAAAAAAAATHHQHQQNNPNAHGQHSLFPGFDANSGLAPWNVAESSSGGGNVGGGFVFNVPFQQQAVAMHQMLGHQGQFFTTQRGPLQSSNPPFARAWADPMSAAAAAASSAADYSTMHSVIHTSFQSIDFASGSSSFSGFRIPARIQGEEEHDGLSDKPSSASSGSHH